MLFYSAKLCFFFMQVTWLHHCWLMRFATTWVFRTLRKFLPIKHRHDTLQQLHLSWDSCSGVCFCFHSRVPIFTRTISSIQRDGCVFCEDVKICFSFFHVLSRPICHNNLSQSHNDFIMLCLLLLLFYKQLKQQKIKFASFMFGSGLESDLIKAQ